MARRTDAFDPVTGRKIPSQHSPIREGSRIAGPPGAAPRWQASLVRSWNHYERKDRMRRTRALQAFADDHGPFELPASMPLELVA